MKILIKLPKSVFIEDLNKEIFLGKFEKYFVNPKKKFSDKRNTVFSEELDKEPHVFEQNGFTYLTLDADFLDNYKQLKRLAQIITLKDLGRISTLLGLNRNSIFVEAGSGSGAATVYFSHIVKEIHSYEINDEHLAIAKENAHNLGAKNITFYNKNIYEEINNHKADAFLLDVPDPKRALDSVHKTLRMGGRAVLYTPNLSQAQEAILDLPKTLLYEGTIQVTEREWNIKPKVLRPKIQGLGHTAFLTTVRKIPK